MGSGLILLIIVGAWLAVLVPMGLRGHDNASTVRGAERFSDAMRVLSRRPTGNERTSLMPRRLDRARTVLSAARTPAGERIAPMPSFLDRDDDYFDDVDRPPLTLAARRRRVLLVLVILTFVTGVLSLLGSGLLRGLSAVFLLLSVGFVVHCRRQVLARQRAGARDSWVAAPAVPHVAGIPSRMPARPSPLDAPLPAAAVRYDEPVAGTTGAAWEPVPVPPPTYVGKAVAPRSPRRVVDLTKPGEWSAASEGGVLADIEDGKDLDVILERRRAVGGW